MRRFAQWWLLWIPFALAAACSDFDSEPTSPGDAGADADADASIVTDSAPSEIDAANDGTTPRLFRYVFVSSTTHDPKFGGADAGLTGADAFCTNLTLGTSLAGLHWRAWLGTAALNPRDRIADAGVVPYDYQLVTGELVLRQGYQFIAGALVPVHNVDRDEHGKLLTSEEVWTGSYIDGRTLTDLHCNDWTDNTSGYQGMTGYTSLGDAAPTSDWIATSANPQRQCNTSTAHHIYCFEVDP